MEEKIPKINNPNYKEYDSKTRKKNPNVFVQFSVGDDLYQRFRQNFQGPYPTEIFYNSLVKEFGIRPDTKQNSDWTLKHQKNGEKVYELLSGGVYEADDKGIIYLMKNGGCVPGPSEEVTEKISKENGLELRIKELVND